MVKNAAEERGHRRGYGEFGSLSLQVGGSLRVPGSCLDRKLLFRFSVLRNKS